MVIIAGCGQEILVPSPVDLFVGLSSHDMQLPTSLTPTLVNHVTSFHFYIPLTTQVNPIQCGRGPQEQEYQEGRISWGPTTCNKFKAMCCPLKPGL